MHGGELAVGAGDDSIRHAITRLAHIHLVATEDSRRRLLRSGEQSWRIHLVGAPGPEAIAATEIPPRSEVMKWLRLAPQERFALVVQHPCGFGAATEHRYMVQTLRAVRRQKLSAVVIYPNSDPGYSGIVRAIQTHCRGKGWAVFRSLPHERYAAVLAHCEVMVGNSSSGIIEAVGLRKPVVNIGPRQLGRLRTRNVIDSDYGTANVAAAIEKALNDDNFRRSLGRCNNAWRAGGSPAAAIAKILATVKIDRKLRIKQLSY